MKGLLSLMICVAIGAATLPPAMPAACAAEWDLAEITYNYDGTDHTRKMEKLSRGLVAVGTESGVYLSWRLLGDECSVKNIVQAPDFSVYKNGTKIADVTDSTNYLDTSGTISDSYTVAVESGEQCASVIPHTQSFFDIDLEKPEDFISGDSVYSYTIGDCSPGDLDGDGEYEIVVKWDCNPQDNSNSGITGNVLLDAYEMNGTKLWRIDLGRNIRAGAHYTQFLVYDFDMDGRAEITCKTAPGSLDGNGNYVSEAQKNNVLGTVDNTASYINESGYILEGPEYFTVFDGETGAALDTINYPNQRVSAAVWGDTYGNRCDRYIADMAYLDGEKPYAVYFRGYYHGNNGQQRTGAFGASFDGTSLNVEYIFDTLSGQPGYTAGNELYVGQGNHNMTVADVDDDGMDEFITGALCMEVNDDNKLVPKWCTFKGHGDALHIGDYDPTHKGLEFFTVHEEGGGISNNVVLDYGMSVIDPMTGEILFHNSCSKDTGRGVMANTGVGGYYQISASSGAGNFIAMGNNDFESADYGAGTNFRVFWDADLYDEILDGTAVSAWDGNGFSAVSDASYYGAKSINGTKANPALQADLFGDWREELVYPSNDDTALRVFISTDLTEYKMPTLMHDPVYRSGVTAEQTAYNQPPHIGFYLADEIFKPKVEGISVDISNAKTEYMTGDKLDTSGLVVNVDFEDGSKVTVTGYVVTGYDSNSAGEQVVTVTYGGMSASYKVTVNSGFTINENGLITGYILNNTSATVPEMIDGIEVKGFDDYALRSVSLTEITITAGGLTFGKDVFGAGITVICYLGSTAYAYAKENSIDTSEIDTKEYTVNEGFDYDITLLQGRTSQTLSIGHMTYGVGGRKQDSDGQTGFTTSNGVLRAQVGRFYTNNRQAYINITDMPAFSNSVDTVFETKMLFSEGSSTSGRVLFTISDRNGVVDEISENKYGLAQEVWYKYKLIYHKGAYYRTITDAEGNEIHNDKLNVQPAEFADVYMKFTLSSGTIGNNQNAYMALDDLQSYTNTEFSNINIAVKNSCGEAISKPKITIDEIAEIGTAEGTYSKELRSGTHSITVEADGYKLYSGWVSAYQSEVDKEIILEELTIPVSDIYFESSSCNFKVGQKGNVNIVVEPENADNKSVKITSDNTSVAIVDNKGNIRALREGTARLTAVSVDNGLSAVCTVNVFSDYESELQSIEIKGPEKMYIPSNGEIYAKFSAVCRDRNNVPMGCPVEWSVSDGLVTDNGIVKIPCTLKSGYITVTAVSGTQTAEAELQLEDLVHDNSIIGAERLAEKMNIFQGTEVVTKTIDDITYTVGARSNGGEIYTGFLIDSNAIDGKNCLVAKAGQWTSGGRHGCMTFDNAGTNYAINKDYVFETDLYISGGIRAILTDADNTELYELTAAGIGIENNRWYHYMLIYSDGEYTEYIFDSDNNLIKKNMPPFQDGTAIKNIKFLQGTGETRTYMGFHGLRYYAVDSAVSRLTVQVKNNDAQAAEGAEVNVGGVTALTDRRGKVVIELPIGTYDLSVSHDGLSLAEERVTLDGTDKTLSYDFPPESCIKSVLGTVITAWCDAEDSRLYAARYNDDGTLSNAAVFNICSMPSQYDAGFEIDKAFIWTDMIPIECWTR